jgi:rod shape-determining protein MreD
MNPEKPLLPQGPELIAPPSWKRVVGSLALAFLLTLLPWPGEWRWLIPDFTLMALLYWHIHAPQHTPMGIAFGLGLLTDATRGALFGQHAVAYALTAYLALILRRRLENFTAPARAVQLAPLFIFKELAILLFGLIFVKPMTDWRYLAAGIVAALLWLPLAMLLDRIAGRPWYKTLPSIEPRK